MTTDTLNKTNGVYHGYEQVFLPEPQATLQQIAIEQRYLATYREMKKEAKTQGKKPGRIKWIKKQIQEKQKRLDKLKNKLKEVKKE